MFLNCALNSNQLLYFFSPLSSTITQSLRNILSSKKSNVKLDDSNGKYLDSYFENYNEQFSYLKGLNLSNFKYLCQILHPSKFKFEDHPNYLETFSIVKKILEKDENLELLLQRIKVNLTTHFVSKTSLQRYFSENKLFKRNANHQFYKSERGFKTFRTKGLGTYKTLLKNKKTEPSLLDIFSSFQKKSDDKQGDVMKNLLSDVSLSSEKDKLKISFAEGYLAGESKKKLSGRKMNFLAGIRELIIFIIIIGMLFSVVGGPIKQLIMGNGNEVHPEDISDTFNDVRGIPEVIDELQEVVDFLKNPHKFSSLGGKLPKGVLLVGPPGTGKTLLARAVAGEANVPFFHAVGSEFDEVLVGQGARRVRNLFGPEIYRRFGYNTNNLKIGFGTAAKEKSPCVIFIDEIDSVGAKRSKSEWHPYANQTVNQLLAEMDGFHKNEGIIVLGATNRKEDLDKALIRPGRFDMEVHISSPDLKGRTDIFNYYLDKVKTNKDVDAIQLAKGTTGYTGADIENLVNQAALRAAKDSLPNVNMRYLENARDKILMGPEKKSRIPDKESNRITAYHEAGHTLVSYFTKDSLPLHKVTIIPRGFSLGHTASLPDKEMYYQTKAQILAALDAILAGRAAEELIFGSEKITSGASDDLKKATEITTELVKSWGMSDKVGLRVFKDNSNAFVNVSELGETMTESIDAEINRLLNESYERAKSLLKNHTKEHHLLAQALLKYETLNADDIKNVIEGKTLIKNI
ncbi:ATP-dependent zinc metalloprotease YME1L-like isoform X2 [Gordionus sp. m RMFG-2023]|uniref:ATP-dependent zinc metalloprotease YME1L-like isoform X2 n=1 Tax=Gordionus sp. m RMFG-2023 TaxID=3053472 RepID=UPI0031FD1A6F